MAKKEKVERKDDWRHKLGNYITVPVAKALSHTPFTPNALTWMGLLFTFGAIWLLLTDHLIWAGVVTLAGAIFDSFDGALARTTGKVTLFGGILDSTMDRITEGLMLVGIVVYAAVRADIWCAGMAACAIVMSYLVSYIRARAEAASIECSAGWFTRVERIIILVLGLLTKRLLIAVIIIAALSMFTAAQRLIVVWNKTKHN